MWLARCDGRTWLDLDEAARTRDYIDAAPLSDRAGWDRAALEELTGFIATA